MKKLKVLLKRKKIVLLLFIPFMLAMQCEDDTLNSGFETEYIIHNDSSTDLIFFTELDTQIPIESKTSYSFASDLNQTTDAIKPSDSFVFTQVKLFKEEDGSFILVYEPSYFLTAFHQITWRALI